MILEMLLSAVFGAIVGILIAKILIKMANKKLKKEMIKKIENQKMQDFKLEGEKVKITDVKKLEELQNPNVPDDSPQKEVVGKPEGDFPTDPPPAIKEDLKDLPKIPRK